MNIYARPGTKLIFAHPNYGYNYDRAHAAKHLTPGKTYTLKRTDVGRSSTRVYLEEIPDTWFNSVQFEGEA